VFIARGAFRRIGTESPRGTSRLLTRVCPHI
jgi:hypothetical protein